MSRRVSRKESKEDIRARIANYIHLHPGASFNNIAAIFGLADSTLRYHLTYMEKKGHIRSRPDKRIYFPAAGFSDGGLSRTQQQLIRLIKEQSGVTQKELVRRTRMNRFTVRGGVRALVEKEVVTTVKIGRSIHHFYVDPDELRRRKMIRLAALFLLDKIDEKTYWELRQSLVREE